MIIKIKILESDRDEWVGIFGDCVKLRLKSQAKTYLEDFLIKDFGLPKDLIKINFIDDFAQVEVPDETYEILMSSMP